MKKSIVLVFVLASSSMLFAQNERYVKAMKDNIAGLDTIRTAEGWTNVANTFQRIADTEKSQWLPYYYAALATVSAGYNQSSPGSDLTKLDPIADKAEQLIEKAESLSKPNSETYVVRKMINTLRMMVDPSTRWQTYGPKAAEALAKAKQLNPENPRVYMLEGQDKFFTPEQFGGSKAEAKKLFEEAMQKFEAFKPASELEPVWGAGQTKYFYGLVNQ